MPIKDIKQPEIINIDKDLRLRAYDGNFLIGLEWYQNEVVYYNSEGIKDKSRIPDEKYVEGMYTTINTSEKSELYFIEVLKDGVFIPIGDVALQGEKPPIVIGVDEYRGIGIGRKVMIAIISRARKIGFKGFYNTIIYDYNVASQKLYESLGFTYIRTNGKNRIYELSFD